jgi:OmpA-OmpF porin, OOP family
MSIASPEPLLKEERTNMTQGAFLTKRIPWLAASVAATWATGAAAVHVEQYPVPYFGLAGQYVVPDSAREAGHGEGVQLTLGVPMESPNSAVEVRYFDTALKDRFPDGKKDFQTSLFVDYVLDFGTLGSAPAEEAFLSGIKPFVTGGLGLVRDDVLDNKHSHLGLALGGGVIVPVGWNGWSVRFDARAQGQANSKSVPDKSMLVDYQATLGLQIPMTLFFDRPGVPKAVEEECPIAVVDPETGRRDCATDSDGDGIGDRADQCPSTALGTLVDAKGCPKKAAANDADGDGVPNDDDDCPNTQRGLKVDDDGCVVAQKTAIRGVTFRADSAELTDEGRATLDGVAETLKAQEDLKAEIAGHTDSVGSEAYNTLLSQQRADAVLKYLVQRGIEESRMSAVGYGELEPVAPNDTEDGRRSNRRVEFRISTD